MPKTTKKSEDVIQRAYLLKKLARMKREWDSPQVKLALSELVVWLKAQAARAKRLGGIGRK